MRKKKPMKTRNNHDKIHRSTIELPQHLWDALEAEAKGGGLRERPVQVLRRILAERYAEKP